MTFRGGRGPGIGRAPAPRWPVVALAAVLTGACAAPRSTSTVDTDRPSRALAATPASAAPSAAARAAVPPGAATAPGASSPRPANAVGSGRATPDATAAGPGSDAATPPAGPAYRLLAEFADPVGDAEGAAPAYADLVALRIADGGGTVRIGVEMAGEIPRVLPEAETLGVGVDFFRGALQTESDHQLYVDGGPDGWFAYLHTPQGFVRYPGRFDLGRRRLVFTLPWSALGDPAGGRIAAFSDWARDLPGVNPASEDHVPHPAQSWSR